MYGVDQYILCGLSLDLFDLVYCIDRLSGRMSHEVGDCYLL